MSELRICKRCGSPFVATATQVKFGWGTSCSRKCHFDFNRITLEDRFWNFVGENTNSGCILWKGSRNYFGYGCIKSDRAKSGVRRTLNSHRVSYELMVGPIPMGFEVLHSCDNPPCINPVHLFLGTHKDNMRDMWKKGRGYDINRGAIVGSLATLNEKAS